MASPSTPSIHKRSNNDASSSTPPVHKKSKFDASPSSPSIHKRFTYDVFLSFRGIDTRTNFVDHLYDALQHKGVRTYKDDERITKGKQICDELIRSIQDSKLYIIVFSKNYASSSWCLDELVEIMECQKTNDHTAYPVFYDVEPTEVRHQSGAVEEAFKKHENKAAAGKWRMALKEAANLAGWELADGHETKFIKKVVEEISLALRGINSNIDDKLVGMETRISGVLSSFEIGYNDTRMIGIKGMGGAGKTTLARAIFDQISFQFEGKSFVENVRELSGASFLNLKSLQNQILSDVFNDKSMTVSSVHEGIDMMKKRMRGKKVILVLDDVDDRKQLKALAGDMTWFKPGSIIIITTRDQQVLEFYEEKLIHDVQLLSDEDAMCLFRRNAFRKANPNPRYEELSRQFVNYAAGLPLAIEVLGSFLCGKDELEWMDALSRLKTIPSQEILEILEISFCGLEKDYKEIFLNVACFLKRWRKDKAIQALESCGYYARNGLRVLELKSLITVDQDGRLGMHDHIVEMGMNIVRRSHPDSPNKHSRLWIDKEIKDILTKDLGTEETRYIKFNTPRDLSPENVMKGLRKMKELRFLHLSGEFYGASEGENWKFNELPNALQYLCWQGYPFRSLPTTFHADNLVTLKIPFSRIVQLWEGEERKVLNKLRFLDLSCSKLKTFDLGVAPNLETLNLVGCDDLIELLSSDGCLNLRSLIIHGSKLSCLDLRLAPNLETLDLEGCDDLIELLSSDGCLNLRSLIISGSKLSCLDLRLAPNLETLDLEGCDDLIELLSSDGCLKLRSLIISGSTLSCLDLRLAPNLETLDLEECDDLIELRLPEICLNLRSLKVSGSKLSCLDLRLAPNLETLDLEECDDLIELRLPEICLNLRSLKVSGSKLSCLDLRLAPNLETLDLEECDDLIELRLPEICLNLRSLKVSGSKLSCLDVRLAPNLETLDLGGCFDLIELLSSDGCLKLRSLIISGSKLSCLDLRLAPNLETLDLGGCFDLIELLSSDGCLKLRSLIISGSKLSCLDLRLAPNLETLDLGGCNDLIELLSSDGCLNLRSLRIFGSKLSCLDLRLAPNLETLDLGGCYDLIELLSSDGCLKLRSLIISGSKLSCLDLRLAPNLETLNLVGCDDLIELLSSDGCLNLRSLIISGSKLSCLDLRLAPNLETLDIRGCYDLIELLSSDGCLNLRSLRILGSKLSCLDLRWAPNLETLDLAGCDDLIKLRLPETCLNLRSLEVSWSKLRTLDIGLSPKLKHLDLSNCHDLEEIHMADGCLENIVHLNLVGCLRFESFRFEIKDDTSCSADESLEGGPLAELHLIAESLHKCDLHPDSNLPKLQFKCDYIEDQPLLSRNLEKLISVGLCACTNIDTISRSICGLQHLRKLKLRGSFPEAPKALDQLECLQELDFSDTKIRHLPDNICVLKHLKSIDLFKCSLLEKLPEDLGQLECLEKLVLSYTKIKHLPGSICKLKHLNFLDLGYCSLLQKLPEDLGQLECLKKLDLSNTAIKDLPDGICMLKHLGYLDLNYCSFLEKLPEGLGQLECLKRLNLWFAKIKYLPDSICMLQRLESLDLSCCSLLEKLPEDLGRLECLEDLDLRSCELLRAVPDSICNMKCLKHLNLEGCIRVEKLPEEIGRLKCLKSLKLHNTGISHLPQSIFLLQGMRIYGSRGLLQSFGFTSEIQRFYGDSYYNALIRNNELEY